MRKTLILSLLQSIKGVIKFKEAPIKCGKFDFLLANDYDLFSDGFGADDDGIGIEERDVI